MSGSSAAAVGCGYLVLTASYSLWLRRVVVADMLAIAAGFVLRAVAGGAATDVPLSRWFLVVTSCGAIFVVAGKRYAELFGAPQRAAHARDAAALLRIGAARDARAQPRGRLAPTRSGRSPAGARTVYEGHDRPVVLWLRRYADCVSPWRAVRRRRS